MFRKRRLPPRVRRTLQQETAFRCGYCRGRVRVIGARVAMVRGELRYVHAWHPVRAGETRLLH
ncbi:hypothetical protein EDD99_4136 [Streptomyces sp. 846.5]|nr:hypothetical protein EDD99_4136 [Streptomyces sp. 846.5]